MNETDAADIAMAETPAVPVAKAEDWAACLARWTYPLAVAISLSIWFLALRAPLWLDETLSYWQVSGGFAKVWTRSKLLPSSIGYLYTLWAAKSLFGSSEIALKLPSAAALMGAVYFLYRSARELFDAEMGYTAAVFFALQYNIVFAATDARPYAFALLATSVTIFAFIRWMKGQEMRQAVAFGVAAAGILYFHYLFSSILPAFAMCYLVARFRSIRKNLRQLAAILVTFALLITPLIYRVLSLFRTRETHVVQPVLHPVLLALNNLASKQLLIGFVITLFLAAVVRKIRLAEPDTYTWVLLLFLLALVPAGVLAGVSVAGSAHLIIPRYFSIVAPGSALTWAWLTSRIDSRLLRTIFCAGLVTVTAIEAYSSPASRHHELSFKAAHEFVNANTSSGQVPIYECSAFIESDYEPLPADNSAENALLSQIAYYPIHSRVILMPLDFNEESARIGRDALMESLQQRQRFIVVAPPSSYPTLRWINDASQGAFRSRLLGEFNEIVVADFTPLDPQE